MKKEKKKRKKRGTGREIALFLPPRSIGVGKKKKRSHHLSPEKGKNHMRKKGSPDALKPQGKWKKKKKKEGSQ